MNDLTYSKPTRRKKAKGPTARYRAKRKRAEGPVIKAVRAACVERDGHCRIGSTTADPLGDEFDFEMFCPALADGCDGRSEWAHIESRARTRNMKPELRHNTATSLMLCKHHHDRLDGRARPRLRVTVTGAGADGPLTWRTA